MPGTVWIRVSSRAELEALRRRRVGDVYVIPNGRTQIYGRPGDTLCVELSEADVAINPRRVVAGAPLPARVPVSAPPARPAVPSLSRARAPDPPAGAVHRETHPPPPHP